MSRPLFFLQLSGLLGESQQQGFTGSCEIVSWGWGASHGGTFHTGSGGGKFGQVFGGDVTIHKFVDKASPELAQAVTMGSVFPTATITSCKDTGSNAIGFHVVTLNTVKISSYMTGAEGGNVTEYFALHFKSIEIKYTAQADLGTAGAPTIFQYNFAEGKKGLG
jgi:type VI secretion system secreted protein Hcp